MLLEELEVLIVWMFMILTITHGLCYNINWMVKWMELVLSRNILHKYGGKTKLIFSTYV